jgi:prevent-host-death family protein
MTRKRSAPSRGSWALQDAKARFSEVVRKAKTDGPQRVTLHGREEVVIVSVDEYRRVKGEATGEALVKLMQDSPLGDVEFERLREESPVRDVEL